MDISGSLTEQNQKVLELSDYSFWVFHDTDEETVLSGNKDFYTNYMEIVTRINK